MEKIKWGRSRWAFEHFEDHKTVQAVVAGASVMGLFERHRESGKYLRYADILEISCTMPYGAMIYVFGGKLYAQLERNVIEKPIYDESEFLYCIEYGGKR